MLSGRPDVERPWVGDLGGFGSALEFGLDKGLRAIYIAFVAPIIVPPERLSAEALTGIIEAYVLREGTDYGLGEHSFASKCEQVRRQLTRGDVAIVFDPESEQCLLVPRNDVPGTP